MAALLSAGGIMAGCKNSPIQDWDGDGSDKNPYTDRLAHGPLDPINSRMLYCRLKTASTMKALFPRYSTCNRCDWPWAVIQSASVWGSHGRGMFAICRDCWDELMVSKYRLPYYKALYDSHPRAPEESWKDYETAITLADKQRQWIVSPKGDL